MTPTREEVIRVARECGITFAPMVVDGVEYQFRHVRFHDPNCDSDEADCIERLAHHFYEAGAAAAREPLQKDAERYRWLKENCALGIKQNGVGWSLNTRQCAAPDRLKDVDATIDAAIKENKT